MLCSDRKAVVYCSASFKIDPKYNQAAREYVRTACLLGYGIVSGGTIKSTMKIICDEALKYNVPVEGVIPRFMQQYVHPGLTKVTYTDTMAERKELMREGTSVAIALPGGIGTMDELMETATLAKLGRYSGKVVVCNVDGFYNPLKALLDHMVEHKMLEPGDRDLILFPETVEEFAEILK